MAREVLETSAFIGTFKSVKPAHTLGSEGDYPIAIVEHEHHEVPGLIVDAWLPLQPGQEFLPGTIIEVKKVTTSVGENGGVLTEYFMSEAIKP